MRDDIFNVIGVVHDGEIKTPTLVDAGLPQVLDFIVFLGAQRRVQEVESEEPKLLFKGTLHIPWRVLQCFDRAPAGRRTCGGTVRTALVFTVTVMDAT